MALKSSMSWEYQVSGVPLLTWLALSRHMNGSRPSTGALRLTLSACAQGAGSGAAAGPTKCRVQQPTPARHAAGPAAGPAAAGGFYPRPQCAGYI